MEGWSGWKRRGKGYGWWTQVTRLLPVNHSRTLITHREPPAVTGRNGRRAIRCEWYEWKGSLVHAVLVNDRSIPTHSHRTGLIHRLGGTTMGGPTDGWEQNESVYGRAFHLTFVLSLSYFHLFCPFLCERAVDSKEPSESRSYSRCTSNLTIVHFPSVSLTRFGSVAA